MILNPSSSLIFWKHCAWLNCPRRTLQNVLFFTARHCGFVSNTPEQRTCEPDESEIIAAWSRLQHAGLHLVEDVSINDYVDVDAATAVCESPDDLAVQQTNNQSEDQISDHEFIVEDPEPVLKRSLINCLEALLTLHSYFHYEGTECDEDMERIEKVLRKKADSDNR